MCQRYGQKDTNKHQTKVNDKKKKNFLSLTACFFGDPDDRATMFAKPGSSRRAESTDVTELFPLVPVAE